MQMQILAIEQMIYGLQSLLVPGFYYLPNYGSDRWDLF
jgi:hypothetical protein